jgi:sphingolipid delta-4 desaturase
MLRSKDSSVFSADPEPHRARTRELLKRHPELRHYIGKNPRTFSFILLCVTIQVGAAYMLQRLLVGRPAGRLWLLLSHTRYGY